MEPLVGPAGDDKTAFDARLAKVRTLLGQGKLDAGDSLLFPALKEHPDYVAAWHLYADLMARKGAPAHQVEAFRQTAARFDRYWARVGPATDGGGPASRPVRGQPEQ